MAEPTYDPYAYSPLGERIAGGAHAYRVEGDPNSGYLMNIFWFNPVTGEEGQTTEGWSRVPDEHKPYVYRDPGLRNEARNAFYQSGAAFGGTGGTGGFGDMGGGLLSGQAYAQQIAGGMPFKQVVAPGMSFSPDQPRGYNAIKRRPTEKPTSKFFPSVQDPSVGMTGANLGLPMGEGTPMPAGTTFEGEEIIIPMQPDMGTPINLGLLDDIDVEEAIENIPTPPEPLPGEDFFDFVQREIEFYEQNPDLRPLNPFIDPGKPLVDPVGTDYTYPSVADVVPMVEPEVPAPVATPQPVAAPVVSTPITPPPLPQIVPETQPVIPPMPIVPPVIEAPTPIVDVPMNLGLPMIEGIAPVQIPEIPFQLPQTPQPISIPTLPVVNTPVMPQPMVNLGMTPTNPVLNIDNIVSPIRQGSLRTLLGTL